MAAGPDLAFGTVDSWLRWRLTGGAVHATDATNASRTLLFDIERLAWDPDLADLFGVPLSVLPEVGPSSGRLGTTAGGIVPRLPAGVPISGTAGDQQAALFGQACFDPGMTKNTYGTGSFVLMNVGDHPPSPVPGLVTTVAWSLARPAGVAYALEGSIFVTGAAVQWLRDGLGLVGSAPEIEPLALSVADSGGAYLVPALTGLGSPWWDPYARGAFVGVTRGVGRGQLARAVVEAMAFQTRDVIDAMHAGSGRPVTELRVDGGAASHGPAPSAPGRSARRAGGSGRGAGDHCPRRGLAGRAGRRRLGIARRAGGAAGASTPRSSPPPTGPPPTPPTRAGWRPSGARWPGTSRPASQTGQPDRDRPSASGSSAPLASLRRRSSGRPATRPV